MDFSQISDWAITFYRQYPEFCSVVAAILLLLILWKPFKVLKNVLLLLVLAVIVYAAFYLIGSMNVGMDIKNKAIHRTEKAIK